MKKSQLLQIIREAIGGYEKKDGKLVPHSDKFNSTKLSSILTAIAKGRPEEGDPVRGNKIVDKANPDNVARITTGEKPVYEGAEQEYTVIFYVNDMDYDWDVKATSPEDAIAKVKSGEVKGPYDQTLPRTARAFSAKLKK